MKWIKNLKVGTKLLLGFSIMILFMGIVGLTGFRSTANIQAQVSELFEVRIPELVSLLEADRNLQQVLVAERSLIFTDARSDKFKGLVEDYETNFNQFMERWNKFKENATHEKEIALIQ